MTTTKYLPASTYIDPSVRIWDVYDQAWATLDERHLGAVHTDAILASLPADVRATVLAHIGGAS